VKEFFSFLSIVNLDVETVKPGCSIPLITVVGMFWWVCSVCV
jgi:hypothetical protein